MTVVRTDAWQGVAGLWRPRAGGVGVRWDAEWGLRGGPHGQIRPPAHKAKQQMIDPRRSSAQSDRLEDD